MKKLGGLWIGLLVGAFGTVALAAPQKVIEVQTVRNAILKEKANWTAKETWVSNLSKEEARRLMGLQDPPEGDLDFTSVGTLSGSRADKPAVIDWRNMDGVNWIGFMMNQGNCGSCVAFGTVAALRVRTAIAAGLPWLLPTFSAQQLFACGGGACDYGWTPESAASFLKTDGIVDEACMPYTSGSTGDDVDCNVACADSAQRTLKIAKYTRPSGSSSGSVDTVKAALKSGPLVTTLRVYADFVTYSSGIYKHVTGEYMGGHAVSLVGYDDTKRAWLIQNSWGPEWGEGGFGWVSWDDRSGVASQTWAFELAPASGQLSVVSPANREYVSGQYQLVTKGAGLELKDTLFHVKDGTGHEVGSYPCSSREEQSCAALLDTTALKEGRYEIFAQTGKIRSQVREFYVINSEPRMSISFTPAPGTDLTKPVSGRPEFLVQVKQEPVPIQHLEFRAIDKTGKIASIKTNDDVLENMKMGWRTMSVPNGEYQILFHGETRFKDKVYSVDSPSVTITVKN